MTITAKELRDIVTRWDEISGSIHCDYIFAKNAISNAADAIEELEMELVCRPAKLEVAKCDLKSNFMDWWKTHDIKFKSEDSLFWDSLFKLYGHDQFNAAYNAGMRDLESIKSWLNSEEKDLVTLEERVFEVMKGQGFCGGRDQAKKLIGMIKLEGGCDTVASMKCCLNCIFPWNSKRDVKYKWANEMDELIKRWVEMGKPKKA